MPPDRNTALPLQWDFRGPQHPVPCSPYRIQCGYAEESVSDWGDALTALEGLDAQVNPRAAQVNLAWLGCHGRQADVKHCTEKGAHSGAASEPS